MTDRDDWTLAQARDWLRERVDEGERCPCCDQLAKVYRRKLTSSIGAVLIAMWRTNYNGWVYLPAIRSAGQDEVIARFWFLIEGDEMRREDGSKRTGWWRLTDLGVGFVHNEVKVPKYARIYNNRLLNLDPAQSVSIVDVLGAKFDYTELMEGR